MMSDYRTNTRNRNQNSIQFFDVGRRANELFNSVINLFDEFTKQSNQFIVQSQFQSIRNGFLRSSMNAALPGGSVSQDLFAKHEKIFESLDISSTSLIGNSSAAIGNCVKKYFFSVSLV